MGAIEAVLEVGDLVFDALIAPLLPGIGLLIMFALVMLALSPPSFCTGSSKEKAFLTAQRSDLRNLVVAQETRYATDHRYAEVLSPDEYRLSTGVVLVSMAVGPSGFTAVTAYPGRTEKRCRITYKRDEDATPICDK